MQHTPWQHARPVEAVWNEDGIFLRFDSPQEAESFSRHFFRSWPALSILQQMQGEGEPINAARIDGDSLTMLRQFESALNAIGIHPTAPHTEALTARRSNWFGWNR